MKRSQQSSVGYHMSVTRLPTAKDVAEEESGSCYLCPESVRRILTTMLDLSLLKSPTFLILAISGALTMMGFYTPFMYVPGRYTSDIDWIVHFNLFSMPSASTWNEDTVDFCSLCTLPLALNNGYSLTLLCRSRDKS